MAEENTVEECIEVRLDETLRRFVEAQVRDGGYTDAAGYLTRLVRDEQKRLVRQRVTTLLKEGARAAARERSQKDWQALRSTAITAARPGIPAGKETR